jgi:hypothetical protein
MKKNKKGYRLFVSFWTLLRIVAVITLWIWHPFWGALLNIIIDAVDGHMFESFGVKRNTYEVYDKWLDLWFYIALFVFVIQKLNGSPYYLILIILFFVRLIGILSYAKLNKEWLLFTFPNLFEPVFLVVVGFPQIFSIWGKLNVFLIIFVLKMFIEWWIHLAKLDFTSLVLGKPTKWYKNRKKL